MIQPTPVVSIHPYFKVHSGKLEEFKAALPAFIEKSRDEPKSLYYELTHNGDEFFCREGYVGAEGVLAHVANVGAMLAELLKISKLTRLEIHGPAAEIEKLKVPLAAFNPMWFTTAYGVERQLVATVLRGLEKRELRSSRGEHVPEDTLAKFATAFHGQLIRPGDPDYGAARRIWNASIDKRPGIIARCSGTADVVTAVNFARENDLLAAVRGGGHNVGGRALCDGGIVIDLSRMKGIHVDPLQRRVRLQAGLTLGEIDRETHLHGLAIPAGVISKTGIAGLTLGGGVGWLVRKYGMACDNVVSFEIVTADGRVLVASADKNPDLFWGLRGGGGNFGVVTAFEFRAYPVSTVFGGLAIFPRTRAVELLQFYREFTRNAPDELALHVLFMHLQDGTPGVMFAGCFCGDVTEGEKAFKPLRTFAQPIVDAFQPLPFPVLQSMFDGAFPDGNCNYWKPTFLRELSDDVIKLVVDRANHATSPLTAVLVEFSGGAMGRVPVTDTAFAQRTAVYDIGILTQWANASESPRHIEWTRQFASALQPFSNGGYMLNYLDQEGDDTIKAAFGPNHARLAALKKKYDPTNFFRMNQNVKPTP